MSWRHAYVRGKRSPLTRPASTFCLLPFDLQYLSFFQLRRVILNFKTHRIVPRYKPPRLMPCVSIPGRIRLRLSPILFDFSWSQARERYYAWQCVAIMALLQIQTDRPVSSSFGVVVRLRIRVSHLSAVPVSSSVLLSSPLLSSPRSSSAN